MFDSVKIFVKQNIAPILFFGCIIFVILSVIISNNEHNRGARDLASYADSSISRLNSRIVVVTDKTLILENKPENYDQTQSDLQGVFDYLDSEIKNIPHASSDQASVNLQTSLKNFYLKVQVTIKALHDRLGLQKAVLEPSMNYAKLTILSSQGGLKADLQKAYEGGLAVNAFNKTKSQDGLSDFQKSSIVQQQNEESARLDKLKTLFDSIQNEELSDNDKEAITQIFAHNLPPEKPPFPRIDKTDIETTEFYQDIQTLQKFLSALKQQYNIT